MTIDVAYATAGNRVGGTIDILSREVGQDLYVPMRQHAVRPYTISEPTDLY